MLFPREIEAKYRVTERRTFTELLALGVIGPFALYPAHTPVDQVNTYYDSLAQSLRLVKHSFRVRAAAGRSIATLKGPVQMKGDLHIRHEWEEELPGPDPALEFGAGAVERLPGRTGRGRGHGHAVSFAGKRGRRGPNP